MLLLVCTGVNDHLGARANSEMETTTQQPCCTWLAHQAGRETISHAAGRPL